MNRKIILIGAVIAGTIAFTACGDKEEISVEENTVDVLIDNNENTNILSLYDNDFSIDARLIPDGLDSVVDVKITSNADPVGFTTQVNLTDGSYTEGKIVYLYKRCIKSFSVALFTDTDKKLIKVGETGDIVTIDIGNGLYTEQISFDASTNVALTYWSQVYENAISATCFIYDYNFDGSQSPNIEVWTSYDDTKLTYDLEWNDPTQYNGLPAFNNYDIGIDFTINGSTGNGEIGASDGCTVYIKYNGVTYTNIFHNTTSDKLPIQS